MELGFFAVGVVGEDEPRAYTLYHDLGAFQWVARAIQHQEGRYRSFWWRYYWGSWNGDGDTHNLVEGVCSDNAPRGGRRR